MSVIAFDQPNRARPPGDGADPLPFADTRDRRLYFPAAGHEAVIAALQETLAEGHAPFAAVTGGSGSGKTYLRTMLHARLDPAQFVRVSIESSLLDFDQLLLEIISQISGRRALAADWPDRYARLAELKRILAQQVVRPGRQLVVLLDEAQGLSAQTLEGLRHLSNICTEQRGIMTFVLFGSPALEDALQELPELARRIGRSQVLQPLDREATRAYVLHRMSLGGSPVALQLSAQGWDELHRATGGLPGNINRLMHETLRRAARDGAAVTDDLLAAARNSRADTLHGHDGIDWEGLS